MIKKVAVLSGGCWGVTLASLLSEKDVDISLWEFDSNQARRLEDTRRLASLPRLLIPKDIEITSNLKDVCQDADLIVSAIPSRYVRGVAREIAKRNLVDSPLIVSVSKGIERKTLMRLSQVIADELPDRVKSRISVISGPSHSEEVSIKMPTVVVLACQDKDNEKEIQELFSTDYFKVVLNDDIVGVELGGAIKNVIALSTGICDGLKLGDNTKAALITSGFDEMIDLAVFIGAKRETLAGLAGIGDLIVTCLSQHSRNRYLGEKIGKGKRLKDALREMTMVAEGVDTLEAVFDLSQKHKISMPIIEELYNILFLEKEPKETISNLLSLLYNSGGERSYKFIKREKELIHE